MWFKEDIKNTLLAMNQTMETTVTCACNDDQYTRGYRAGYVSALTTIALVFGVLDEIRQLPAGSRTISDAKGS